MVRSPPAMTPTEVVMLLAAEVWRVRLGPTPVSGAKRGIRPPAIPQPAFHSRSKFNVAHKIYPTEFIPAVSCPHLLRGRREDPTPNGQEMRIERDGSEIGDSFETQLREAERNPKAPDSGRKGVEMKQRRRFFPGPESARGEISSRAACFDPGVGSELRADRQRGARR